MWRFVKTKSHIYRSYILGRSEPRMWRSLFSVQHARQHSITVNTDRFIFLAISRNETPHSL